MWVGKEAQEWKNENEKIHISGKDWRRRKYVVTKVVLLYFDTMPKCVHTFESEVQNSLSTLEPQSMDSLGQPAPHKETKSQNHTSR